MTQPESQTADPPWGHTTRAGRLAFVFGLFWPIFLIALVIDLMGQGPSRWMLAATSVVVLGGSYIVTVIRAVRDCFEEPYRPRFRVTSVVLLGCAWLATLTLIALQPRDVVIALALLAVVAVGTLHPLLLGAWGLIALYTVYAVDPALLWEALVAMVVPALLASLALVALAEGARSRRDSTVLRQEEALLAVRQERDRMARDLHDILGHSLAVMAIKSELAGRMMDVDIARARQEIGDVEGLARQCLTEARSAVEGFRELRLSTEMAAARRALESAGIEADMGSNVEADPAMEQLFAWGVRESVTNVIRHSRASKCTITVEPLALTVRDDGVGVTTGARAGGNGLRGLAERAASAGATMVSTNLPDGGFMIQVIGRRPA